MTDAPTDSTDVLVEVGPAVEEASGIWRAPAPPTDLLVTHDQGEEAA